MPSASSTGGNKIFISYRRADTTGYAGRLADSLESYFGKDRVFRDVGSIVPGTDFTEHIKAGLNDAGACIVLIGPRWLASEDGGKPRLHDPDDYVAGEIAAALASRRSVFPVLVEDARMPREEDLPDTLADLARRNAVTITDERWQFDVTRLAKVLALDVTGSVMERRLTTLKSIVLGMLTLAMLLSVLSFSRAVKDCLGAQGGPACDADATTPQTTAGTQPASGASGTSRNMSDEFTPGYAAATFATIGLVVLLLGYNKAWIAPDSRRFVLATVWLGVPSVMLAMGYYTLSEGKPVVDLFAASSIVITAMLALLAMSGFKPNDRVS